MKKQTIHSTQDSLWARITRSPSFIYVLISPLFLILFGYVIFPFYQTFIQSFGSETGLNNYKKFFSLESTANLEALWTSVYISVISVITCAIVGVLMAFLLERYDFPGRRVLSILVLVPMALPPLSRCAVIYIFIWGKWDYSTWYSAFIQFRASAFQAKRGMGRYCGPYVYDVYVLLFDCFGGD